MRKWWPLFAVCAGSFLFLLDTTVVTVALPRIGADLSASVGQLQWVPDIYTLVLAVLMLAAGVLALFALRPDSPVRRGRFDFAGAAWFAVAAASLVHGLTLGRWTSPVTLGALAVSVAGFAGFFVVERRRAEPMLELGLFRDG